MNTEYNDKWIKICIETLIDKDVETSVYFYRVYSLTNYLKNGPIKADAFFSEMIRNNRKWLG